MVLFNYSTKELTAKIVYYGPGLCGKTTNLQFVYESLPDEKKGRMLSLSTQTDRTLYFDFLPVELGDIRGMKTRVQLYTVPGQVFYNETRRMVLKGVDGVVFVADSQKRMADANTESFRNLEANLQAHGLSLAELPLVLQFNKRDLPDIQTIEEMNAALNSYNAPFYEAVATTGIGVHDTLKAISKLVLRTLTRRYDGDEATTRVELDSEPALPAVAAPPAAESWDSEDLETELDGMDAHEIRGLLEEIDGIPQGEDELYAAPPEFSGAQADEDLFHSPDENEFSAPGDDADVFGEAPQQDHASSSRSADDGSVWMGLSPDEEDASSEMTPDMMGASEPGLGDSLADSDLAMQGSDDQADWSADEPASNLSVDSFLEPEDNPSRQPAVAMEAGEETALSFESFLENEQPPDAPQAEAWDHEAPSGVQEPALPMTALADSVAAPGAAPESPSLAAGAPLHAGNGDLRVPLTLELDGRQYTYILTLSLQPDSSDRA